MTQISGPYNEARQYLYNIEAERNVKILFAVEGGSRAWEFDSQFSDFDIKFIYTRPLNSYFGLLARRDVIESKEFKDVPSHIDFSGWDIVKTMELAAVSNSQIMEWLSSPVVYCAHQPFVDELKSIMLEFNPRKVMYSYAALAYKQHKQYLANSGETVWHKRYLYAIRPLLAAIWMDGHKFPHSVMPPLNFHRLLAECSTHPDITPMLQNEIRQLLAHKMIGKDETKKARFELIDKFIEQWHAKIHEAAQLAFDGRSPDRMRLSSLCVETVKRFG